MCFYMYSCNSTCIKARRPRDGVTFSLPPYRTQLTFSLSGLAASEITYLTGTYYSSYKLYIAIAPTKMLAKLETDWQRQRETNGDRDFCFPKHLLFQLLFYHRNDASIDVCYHIWLYVWSGMWIQLLKLE